MRMSSRRPASRAWPRPSGLLPALVAGTALLSIPALPEGPVSPALLAQEGPPRGDSLEVLAAEAAENHPEVRTALRRAEAARARVPQAGTLPDPMLFAGLMNLPLSDPSLSRDGMTMFSLELEQRLPPRGLRAAREAAYQAELQAALTRVEVTRWSVTTRLREAYYELLLVDEAVAVHHRTHAALEALARSAEAAFRQGLAPQADVLRAHTELAAIDEHLSELRQRRSTALAQVNTLLGRETRSPVDPVVPDRLSTLLGSEPDPGFLAAAVVGVELGPGYPTLAELEEAALVNRPELALARHQAEAARHREEAAIRDRRPGISVMGGYGFRSARSDMISLGLSIDLPLFRSRKQDQAVVEAEEELRAQELEAEVTARSVRREVAAAHAALVRAREKLLLLDEAVIPQARATVESREALYRAGQGDFTGLMQAQTMLFRSEIERAHLTAELGQALARLERALGTELTREEVR